MSTRIRAMAAGAVIALGSIACGADDDTVGSAVDDTSTTSTTVSEPTRTTAAAPTPVVLITGDSIIYDVAPAIEAALEPDVAEVVSLVTPTLGTDPNQSTLVDRIRTEDVDVALVMVGIWERAYKTGSGAGLGDAAFAAEYPAEALDPILAAITATGGRLVLTGPPPLRVAFDQAQIAQLESIWQDYADTHDHVDFVDADDWIGGDGVYVDVETNATATTGDDADRLRRTDGIHLCAEGARRIAAGMLEAIAPELSGQPDIDPSWEQAPWTTRFPEDECPADAS